MLRFKNLIMRSPLLSGEKLFLLIFLSAFFIRFAYILTLENKWYYYDTVHWDKAAHSIVQGEGFGSGYYFSSLGFNREYSLEPVYPVFLAGIYTVFGRNFFVVRIFQCLMGATICYLVYVIGFKLFRKSTGIIASLIATFYPLHVFIAGMLYPTLLFTFFIALAILCLLKVNENDSFRYAILGGLFLGLATQCIPIIFAFYPFVAIWFVVFLRKPTWQRWKYFIVAFSVTLLSLVPWTVRNYLIFGKIVPVRAAFGEELLKVKMTVDSNLEVDVYESGINNSSIDKAELARQIESIQSKGLLEKVRGIIFENPGSFLKRYVSEFIHFWIFYPDPDRVLTKNSYLNPWTRWVSILSFGPVFIFGLIGLSGALKFSRESILLVFVILSFALVYSFFMTQIRYRIPIEPYLFIFAAFGFLRIVESISHFITRRPMVVDGGLKNSSSAKLGKE